MSNKTPLEIDIEHHEKYRIPASVYILIVLLIAGLLVIGGYSLDLKRELSHKNSEIDLLKKNYQDAKQRLLDEVRKRKQNLSD
jgi:Tfp pilus assembly protein PilO